MKPNVQPNHTNPCPCCGRLVFDGDPGTEEICPVCYWQDDLFGLLDPFESAGPNKVSLSEAQRHFLALGVCDPRYANVRVRLVSPAQFMMDVGWRPIDRAIDRFLKGEPYPPDEAKCYYWRSDYWLRADGG